MSNKIRIWELKPGDHIYTWRSIYYTHHGIYKGDHKVIHLTNADNFGASSSSSRISACQHCRDALRQLPTHQTQAPSEGRVIISCLDTFLNGGNLYRYPYSLSFKEYMFQLFSYGAILRSDPPNVVLDRACFFLEHNSFRSYNAYSKNCIQFAIYCKTGMVSVATAVHEQLHEWYPNFFS